LPTGEEAALLPLPLALLPPPPPPPPRRKAAPAAAAAELARLRRCPQHASAVRRRSSRESISERKENSMHLFSLAGAIFSPAASDLFRGKKINSRAQAAAAPLPLLLDSALGSFACWAQFLSSVLRHTHKAPCSRPRSRPAPPRRRRAAAPCASASRRPRRRPGTSSPLRPAAASPRWPPKVRLFSACDPSFRRSRRSARSFSPIVLSKQESKPSRSSRVEPRANRLYYFFGSLCADVLFFPLARSRRLEKTKTDSQSPATSSSPSRQARPTLPLPSARRSVPR
jgi:hypothetical protein